jgi:hypothetical protein
MKLGHDLNCAWKLNKSSLGPYSSSRLIFNIFGGLVSHRSPCLGLLIAVCHDFFATCRHGITDICPPLFFIDAVF